MSLRGFRLLCWAFFFIVSAFSAEEEHTACPGWQNYKEVCLSGSFNSNLTLEQTVKAAGKECYDANMKRSFTPCPYSIHSCVFVVTDSNPTQKIHHFCIDDARPYVRIEAEFETIDHRHPTKERVTVLRRGDPNWKIPDGCVENEGVTVTGDVTLNGIVYPKSTMVCCKQPRCDKLKSLNEREKLYKDWQPFTAMAVFATLNAYLVMRIIWKCCGGLKKLKVD
ncbi:unnamed protein product, partial [Mesorhabditis belari]|uniref:Uncharacterized protein n=1 Tax=Mesorhabditis belari TaxID=2138241 RepID=A0AAF3EUT1_9BILA